MAEKDEGDSEAILEQDIEYGETYKHEEHGKVKVTGIWHGDNHIDTSRSVERNNVIAINYSVEENPKTLPEFTDTLDEFIEAIE